MKRMKNRNTKKNITLDFRRLSGDDVSAIAANTLPEDSAAEAAEATPEVAPPEDKKPKEPFEGMYYPLGR